MWLSSGIKKLASPATWWEDLVPKTMETKELREFAIYVHSTGTSIGDVERLHSLFTKCRAANLTSHAPAQPHASSRSQHTWSHPMCTLWQPAGLEAAAHGAQEHEQADQVRHERALPQAEVGRGDPRLVRRRFRLSRERGRRGSGAGNDNGVKCVGVWRRVVFFYKDIFSKLLPLLSPHSARALGRRDANDAGHPARNSLKPRHESDESA